MSAMSDKRTQVEPLFNAAIEARHAGELERARELCNQALGLLDESDRALLAAVHGELGYVHRQLDDLVAAVHHYERSVRASPKSELASLGLFHSFAQLGDWKRALEEVVRFLELRDSAEYRELLGGDGFRDDLGPAERALATRARALIAGFDTAGEDKPR